MVPMRRRLPRSAALAPVALLLLSCGLCFLPSPQRRPRRPNFASTSAAAAVSFLSLPAFAEEEMDSATMALKDATEETFDLKRPNKIDLGEYRGDGPWYVFAVVGLLFFAFTAVQAWNDQFGLSDEVATTSDDYFNPDFDPYKGMNLKKDAKTGKPVR
ncbi:unnamed protein product [Cladocopium goreaui]|uniref:Uncharacterized protein n=1 Tax=Cladocopium goreaui TaxID=2562237 RepID=A0A9P1CDP4_9DINO|nr:unnamed protein product [Cladocopium goreaui]